jgi:hypothetical protein
VQVRPTRRFLPVIAATAALTAGAGCGDDDDGNAEASQGSVQAYIQAWFGYYPAFQEAVETPPNKPGPKWVGWSDNRGDPVVCPGETEPMRVPADHRGPPHEIMEPVPPRLGSGAPAAVARCGPNGKPVWVPETLAGRRTAPRRYWGYPVRPVPGAPDYNGDWTGYAPRSTEKNQGDDGGEG